MNFSAASYSNAGPRAVNEDEARFWITPNGDLIAAVADGLGGMGGGADASRLAVDALERHLIGAHLAEQTLRLAAEAAHQDILRAQTSSPELRRMATTLTAGVFGNGRLLGVHSGDSRAIIARGEGVVRLTLDHSEGERLFRAGKLTKEELRNYPRKNILDSALGVHETPKIETFSFELQVGDKVIFTTDGVHGKIMLRELRGVSANSVGPEEFVREISEVVSSRVADDNFSIVAVFVTS